MNLLKRYMTLSFAVLGLASCASLSAGISANELEATTKVSKTIWLDPIMDSEKTIFVDVRNTSDNKDFNDLEIYVKNNLIVKGYTVLDNPNLSTYSFQVNVRQAVLRDNKGRDSGNESAVQGATAGALVGAASGGYGNNKSMATGILAGAAIGLLADAAYTDSTYYVDADVRIIENKNGKAHTNRTSLTAKKINMELPEAVVVIKQNFAQSLAGMF